MIRQSVGGLAIRSCALIIFGARSDAKPGPLLLIALWDIFEGTTMADRASLKFVGFIFATVTLVVMLTTGMVVKGYADGAYSLEGTPAAGPLGRNSVTIARNRAADQRLQISASTTTATTSSPTNRIMMVPIRGASVRNGMGSVLSGRTLFTKSAPKGICAACHCACSWSRHRIGKFKGGKAWTPDVPCTSGLIQGFPDSPLGPFGSDVSRCGGRPRRASTARHCRRSCGWTSSRPG